MKRNKNILLLAFAATLIATGCGKLERYPESNFSDATFWKTETDLINAANRLYQQLPGFAPDNRADDNTNQAINTISTGARGIPATSADWSSPYDMIFVANNILEKGGRINASDAVKNRYFGEARFFRAFAYAQLIEKYGDVPLVLKTMLPDDPDLLMARTPRAQVAQQIYDDLDFAAANLPTRAALPAAQFGRVTKSTAWALKARVALSEGTRAKFHGVAGYQSHLNVAVAAAQLVMGQGHTLFPSYLGEFTHAGDGASNTENILVKQYALTILTHNTSRDLENGRIAPTRNLIRQFLYTDGLPAWNVDGHTPSATRSPLFVPEGAETSYNTILDNRDPRLATLVYRAGEQSYQRPWVPQTSLGSRTAYAGKKGFDASDWQINNNATVQRILIRYAEVLLIYAEAKYELTETISDADLNLSINVIRTRAGLAPKLNNAFVTANNLSMREEIRRERTVELALEYFRYNDLLRWKIAEDVLPKVILGAKYIPAEWAHTVAANARNADNVLIVEPAANRKFNAARDYLYPIPLQEITLSDFNVVQNPNWQ